MKTQIIALLGLLVAFSGNGWAAEVKNSELMYSTEWVPGTTPVSTRANEKDSYNYAYQIIRMVSRAFNVPAGILYGIWRKESSMLLFGWRTGGGDWFRARDLITSGYCAKKRSESGYRTYAEAAQLCLKHWRALQGLCAQRRRDGSFVCNANEVYTSWALAMGPTQHMPAEILDWTAKGWQWSNDAVDGNGDGIIDPNDLADAMAMTAIQIRRYKERAPDRSWRWAVNRYYGSQRAAYFDGQWETAPSGKRRYRHGVREHWFAWCQTFGCNSQGGAQNASYFEQ